MFEFFDPQGDLLGGRCEVATTVDTTTTLVVGVPEKTTTGSAVCSRSYTVPAPQDIDGTLTLIDQAGHRSNGLGFRLSIRW